MLESKQELLFCEQKRSKKNFINSGSGLFSTARSGPKVFWFSPADDGAALAAKSESGRLQGSKKNNFLAFLATC
jgi:hypothetical protein